MKQKKAKVITVVNPKGIMTRKEVCMYLGCTKMNVSLAEKAGHLVPSAVSYLGTEKFYTVQDLKKYRKEHPQRNWKNKKPPVLA
jgi:hypothetical protein